MPRVNHDRSLLRSFSSIPWQELGVMFAVGVWVLRERAERWLA